jgi:hypothetical protein
MIKFYCDKCKEEFKGEKGTFIYAVSRMIQLPDKSTSIQKVPQELIFCVNCKDKILEFINKK